MKKNTVEELLTFGIVKEKNLIYLTIPMQNLIDPHFSLINNDLYITLNNHTHSYIIKNLPDYLIENIRFHNVFLKENLSIEFNKLHKVVL